MQYLMPAQMANYHCVSCGRCCYEWGIQVTALEFKNIIKAMQQIPDSDPQKPRNYGFELLKNEEGQIEAGYLRMIDNHCGFQQPDQKCFIHSKFGTHLKPDICISFPFYAIRTPKITFLNISFACIAATLFLRENYVFNQIAISPPAHLGKRFTVKYSAMEQRWIRLTPDKAISWETFYLFQKYLTENAASLWNFIPYFYQQIYSLPEQNISLEKMRAILYEKNFCIKTIDKQQKQVFPENKNIGIEIGLNEISFHLKSLFHLISLWKSYVQKSRPLLFSLGILREHLEIANTPQNSEIILPVEVSLESAQKYLDMINNYHACRPELLKILENYLRSHLFISDEYFARSIIEGINILSLATGLALLIAIANIGTDQEILEEYLRESFVQVERYFFHSGIFEIIDAKTFTPMIALAPILMNIPKNI